MKIVSVLAQQLKCSESDILKLILNAPYKYRVYSIPKRTHGRRIIAQPTKAVKELQRSYLKYKDFPFHTNSMAYRKGFSIKDNAESHRLSAYLLKMDLANFFNSLTPDVFWDIWRQHWEPLQSLEHRLVENILFWDNSGKLMLSVGAPSSPAISNFCLYFFDNAVSEYCEKINVIYTRYADDLTFSCNDPNILPTLPEFISRVLKEKFSGKILVNHQKTIFSSKAHNRHVTGITITNDEKLSIGRYRKRYIKHLINQYKYNLLDTEAIYHLKGMISFSNHIEPDFLNSLRKKYSSNLIDEIIEVNK
ncbi:TPA: retron St85 family RNA-directed DNA polymerase [Klebsiella oxytoca]|jgi:RNA-directed DNA polymerase|uniref:retron St85 family RNA-directed DNA polymerase n=1 Tax=Enterobacteriaceae TaxID=543 RepID=UPI000940B588|nr:MULTISPECIES: retron St85 family RNA-directed DNA polymerase [Enterobacteriaceae]HEC2112491.1 retron St85 family RNA-directed DNA polymerase [Klebsiella oxytoca]EIX9148762.1 retron St85 family RNA-directed DNA polymerase [Klebsiella pneumoniae]MBX4725461.1 RNA-directed DNA polymerase [Klebsiella pneumoniae]MDM2974960.1 retron St85 family RNA-directed DNA polymerase [Citrobacter sp. CK198]MDM3289481.1 retron St85 family RNA-directed DNA polymerase [Citrobacter sp. Ce105]